MRFPAVFAASIASLVLTGCASWPDRTVFTASDQAAAIVLGEPRIRYWSDSPANVFENWRARLLADRVAAGKNGPKYLVAISGGSDKGAFSAGLLWGWSQSGKRPEFAVVSGVSTGALIAPFAFLGKRYDPVLKHLYTGISSQNIYRVRGINGLINGPSLLDTKPLEKLIAAYITPALLDEIATAHRSGRRLLVLTTNLDAQRGVVWDMGEIAASQSPHRLALFRQVLLASASIPGVFTPVLIDVTGNGKHFAELHVDGGATASFLTLPQSMLQSDAFVPEGDKSVIAILYNGWIKSRFEVVKPKAITIMRRALTAALTEADRMNISDVRSFAAAHAITFAFCAIDDKMDDNHAKLVDPKFMQRIFDYGLEKASNPGGCLDINP